MSDIKECAASLLLLARHDDANDFEEAVRQIDACLADERQDGPEGERRTTSKDRVELFVLFRSQAPENALARRIAEHLNIWRQ